jgi:hypothetical protein
MNNHNKEALEIGQLAARLLQADLEPLKRFSEAMQANLDPLKRLSEVMQADLEPLKRISEAMQTDLEPLKRFSEAMQANLEPLRRFGEAMQVNLEPFSRFGEAMQANLEPLKRFGDVLANLEPLTRFDKVLANLGPVTRFDDVLMRLAPLPHFDLAAPWIEEQRWAAVSLELGFVPHEALLEFLPNVKRPSDDAEGSDAAERLAGDLWPEIRPRLELSLDDCLGDQKIFQSFGDLLRAHDAWLYQLTTPGAASVIERVARLAQKHQRRVTTSEWLENGVGDLPGSSLSGGLGTWVVLRDETYRNCWADTEADDIPFPNRHAAAHGFGARISNARDSLNALLLAHFAIKAAFAFERFTRALGCSSPPRN